ncbi:hypothetical protein [Kitasatospora purpeofusca]|uniref:hypothetical protein n=1 Tax=Kitasatospora purpeofusca TaxID=67352 RepID=UPI003658E1E8
MRSSIRPGGSARQAVPAKRCYWTDSDGTLTGRAKGGPGQTWTLAKWTPPGVRPDALPAILLTGLLGPITSTFSYQTCGRTGEADA